MLLNPRQEQILNFILSYPHSYPPTVREIAEGVGLRSSATVHSYLNDLEVMGYIERQTHIPRCIMVRVQSPNE
jgi:repressor LexA